MIVTVSIDADMRPFLELPRRLYRHDIRHALDSISKTRMLLARPEFVDRQRLFTAHATSGVVARVVARISPTLYDADAHPIGMLGFFEAFSEDREVMQLLSTAVRWLQDQSVKTIVGPMDGDTWHRYRFNVGPFDQPPFLMEPQNKPYYPRLWQQFGFQVLESYHSKVLLNVEEAIEKFARHQRRVTAHGYRLRPLRLDRFEEELAIIHRISRQIFASNLLYTDIALEDFINLYRPAQSLLDPELVYIAETADKRPVGFLFAIVDYHEAVTAMRGRRGLLAKLRFINRRRSATAVNLKSLGILPEHQGSGLAGALCSQVYQAMLRKGFHRANLCLIRDGNPSGRYDGGLGSVNRRYKLYQYLTEQP